MPRIRLLLVWAVCLGAGLTAVRLAAEHDTVPLSQLVDPESLHRFAIAVGQAGPPAHGEYELTLMLRYNERATLPLGHVELSIDGLGCVLAPGGRPVRPMRVE